MSVFFQLRYKRIKAYLDSPEEYQNRVLTNIISNGYSSEYTKGYSLQQGASYERFSKHLPVVEYDEIRDLILKMMKGERSILWPGITTRFSKSSGTTSDRSKYIPVTKENLEETHLQGAWDAVTFLYHHKPDIRLFAGNSLLMGGSIEKTPKYPNIQCGDISALMIKNTPWIARPYFTPSVEIALLDDWGVKIEKMAEALLQNTDLAMIGGVPTWVVVLFKKLLEITGKDNILEILPNIQAYLHGGVGMSPYINQFKKFLPREDILYQNIYNASEGYFAAQGTFSSKEQEMFLLLNNGIFFEFAPLEGNVVKTDQAVPLWGVQKGKQYALIITNNSGLWRYMPGDSLIFTSLKPYQILLTGRTKQYINIFGEELMIGNADQAIQTACQYFQCEVSDYTVAPIFLDATQKGGHQWVVEFTKTPNNLKEFSKLMDQTLCSINSDYAAKRFENLAMEPLSIVAVPEGTFLSWLKKKGKLGGQNKVPRLSNDRKLIEEILEMLP